MESEIIKKTFKLGNSAGVLLPMDWRDRKVKIKLIDTSINLEIIEILEEKDMLKNTLGIYLAGSYARGEETTSSDIDILVITDKLNKQIKIGNFEIICVSKEKFEKSFKTNLYLVSLVNESKTILNDDLIKNYKIKAKEISIKKNLEDIKSITKINEKSIEIDIEMKKKVSDETLYSLVLRFRELYLIDCIKNSKSPSNGQFIHLIEKIATKESYNAYLRIKKDLKSKEIIPPEEAMSLIKEIKKRVKRIENAKKN